jgi:phage-related protein
MAAQVGAHPGRGRGVDRRGPIEEQKVRFRFGDDDRCRDRDGMEKRPKPWTVKIGPARGPRAGAVALIQFVQQHSALWAA